MVSPRAAGAVDGHSRARESARVDQSRDPEDEGDPEVSGRGESVVGGARGGAEGSVGGWEGCGDEEPCPC